MILLTIWIVGWVITSVIWTILESNRFFKAGPLVIGMVSLLWPLGLVALIFSLPALITSLVTDDDAPTSN